MLAILNSLNAHYFPIFQPILVSKFMVQRVISDKTFLSLGLLSALMTHAFDIKSRETSVFFFRRKNNSSWNQLIYWNLCTFVVEDDWCRNS